MNNKSFLFKDANTNKDTNANVELRVEPLGDAVNFAVFHHSYPSKKYLFLDLDFAAVLALKVALDEWLETHDIVSSDILVGDQVIFTTDYSFVNKGETGIVLEKITDKFWHVKVEGRFIEVVVSSDHLVKGDIGV